MRQTACKTISWLAMVVAWWVFLEADACSAEPPKKTRVDLTTKPLLEQWSAAKAAEYLDLRANADEGTKCLNCHATYAYLPARPWLPAPGTIHAQRRKATEDWAAGLLKEAWSPDVTGDKPVVRKIERRITEALLNATVLAQHDAITTGKLQGVTRESLDLMWKLQRADGGWHWLKTTEPPSATDDHYGVTMVAIGVGLAPEEYAKTSAAQAGLQKMRAYLTAHPPQHTHQRQSGYWYTRSPKINDVLSTYAGSAYVVMALHAGGERP